MECTLLNIIISKYLCEILRLPHITRIASHSCVLKYFLHFFSIIPKRFYHLGFHFIIQYSCTFLHKVTDKWFIIKNTHILCLKMVNIFAFSIRRLLLHIFMYAYCICVTYIIANGYDSVSVSGWSQTTNCMGNSYMICHFLIILISPLVTHPPTLYPGSLEFRERIEIFMWLNGFFLYELHELPGFLCTPVLSPMSQHITSIQSQDHIITNENSLWIKSWFEWTQLCFTYEYSVAAEIRAFLSHLIAQMETHSHTHTEIKCARVRYSVSTKNSVNGRLTKKLWTLERMFKYKWMNSEWIINSIQTFFIIFFLFFCFW